LKDVREIHNDEEYERKKAVREEGVAAKNIHRLISSGGDKRRVGDSKTTGEQRRWRERKKISSEDSVQNISSKRRSMTKAAWKIAMKRKKKKKKWQYNKYQYAKNLKGMNEREGNEHGRWRNDDKPSLTISNDDDIRRRKLTA